MPDARTDGRCPYCGTDCFVGVRTEVQEDGTVTGIPTTVEVIPYQENPPQGEWHNKCVNGHWSKACVQEDLSQIQCPMEQPDEG